MTLAENKKKIQEFLERIHRDDVNVGDELREFRNSFPQITDFRGVEFRERDLSNAVFTGFDLRQSKFIDCIHWRGANFHGVDLSESQFVNCTITGTSFISANLQNATLDAVDGEANFGKANCTRLQVIDSHLCSNFDRAVLTNATFERSDLRGSQFRHATLDGTRFSTVQFDRNTGFADPESINKCSMERYALACLGPDRGGLTEGNLMDMNIVDHVADLRLRFSGIWAWLHVVSIVTFFTPYAWFLFKQWGRARFVKAENHITLIEALGRYIWNGGKDWEIGWNVDLWAVIRFLQVLTYLIIRTALLAKAKQLEAKQLVTNLPAIFSLDSPGRFRFRWRWALYLVTGFFALTILFSIWNTLHFLSMRIPLPGGAE